MTIEKKITAAMAIQLISGRPRSSVLGNALNGSLNSCALIHLPSDNRKIVPRKIVIVPRVTTIGGISSFQTRMPFTIPSSAPNATAMTMIMGTGSPGIATLIIETTMPVRARFAATLRSIQRVRITIIWPMANRISGAVSLKTLARFDGVMNAGKRVAMITRRRAIAPVRSTSRDMRICFGMVRPF